MTDENVSTCDHAPLPVPLLFNSDRICTNDFCYVNEFVILATPTKSRQNL